MQKRSKLTEEERDYLAIWKSKGISVREMGRRLDREHSSILRELKRNRFGQNYVAIQAQHLAQERKSKAGKRHPLKNNRTYRYVLERLIDGWSPEEISGRLREDFGKQVICHETIYQFIYEKAAKKDKLWEYLPRKQKHRRKKYGRKSQRVQIPDRVSIHDRPQVINNREELGHWEGDTVEGKGHKEGIHTEVERVSRFMMATKVPAIKSKETIEAQIAMFRRLPRKLRKSTTLDNGRENHLHGELKRLNMKTYFADPYSSWQRGTDTSGLSSSSTVFVYLFA